MVLLWPNCHKTYTKWNKNIAILIGVKIISCQDRSWTYLCRHAREGVPAHWGRVEVRGGDDCPTLGATLALSVLFTSVNYSYSIWWGTLRPVMRPQAAIGWHRICSGLHRVRILVAALGMWGMGGCGEWGMWRMGDVEKLRMGYREWRERNYWK